VKALVYHHSPLRFLACKALGRVWRRRFFPRIAPVGLRETPLSIPYEDWAILKPRLCGICGSDLALLRGAESYLMEPYGSFPAILGHEVVAEVARAPAGSGLLQGDRVVVDPLLPCRVRGGEPCPACRDGRPNMCQRFLEGPLQPGPVMGYNASVGGGMAEYMAVHPSQLVKIPRTMPDEKAVLADSVASALQPALDHYPDNSHTVLVIGAGIIGQNLIRCLRALGSTARILCVARHRFQAELAEQGGADQVVRSTRRRDLAAALGARFLPTTLGGGNIEGGADLLFDCVGSSATVETGLLTLRAGGKFVLVGTAGRLGPLDVSSLWFRQLTVTGVNCYGQGLYRRRTVRTYEQAVRLLGGKRFSSEGLLTHTHALRHWPRAFRTAFHKARHKSVKVALDMRDGA
jgi:threonine dehydrogenase-like Zn-dependent dehydrogenase